MANGGTLQQMRCCRTSGGVTTEADRKGAAYVRPLQWVSQQAHVPTQPLAGADLIHSDDSRRPLLFHPSGSASNSADILATRGLELFRSLRTTSIKKKKSIRKNEHLWERIECLCPQCHCSP